jgi:palmitoyltransferase
MPSLFTYQDYDTDSNEVLSGEGRAIGYIAGEDGEIELFNSPRRNEYIPTQERYRQEGRVYVELRYCMSCNQNQPLRAKHCRKCEHCIATHDHHCPWLGNCVGERNKRYFFLYLWA